MFKQLRSIFLTGLFVLLPLIITLELLFWGLRQADATNWQHDRDLF